MHKIIRTALVLCITLLFPVQAPAAESASYAVAPFAINGPAGFSYLQKAVPSMLSSRLYWKGHFEPVPDTASSKLGTISGSSAAKTALANSGADYIVWGDINIIGDNAVVVTRVLGKNGKEWHREAKTPVNDMIGSLQRVADGVNAELFGRPMATSAVSAAASGMAQTSSAPFNPNMVQNQTSGSAPVYLNPQIRYQGAEGSRLRTQTLPFTSYGMEVGDFDGDGKNEVALLGKNTVYIYRWTDRLIPLGEYKLPRTQLALAIRSIDLNRDRVQELVVSCVGIDTNVTQSSNSMASLYTDPDDAYSYILSFKGGKFTPVASRLRFYLSVAQLPPDYRPVLVGQKGDTNRGFAHSGVCEVLKVGDTFELGRKLDLPKSMNLFSFTWLPGSGQRESDMLVGLNKDEKLVVFSPNKEDELYVSGETFSGSPALMEAPSSLPGFGKDYNVSPTLIFIPMRMLAVDLDKNHQWELLVNKPISLAAQYFSNFRDYPEGEIHALSWDGVGLSLLWKTRRIKGTVVDFGINDANNDKTKDLVVCVNTYTGALGIGKSRTTIVAYPLDMNRADPNTPPAYAVLFLFIFFM